MRFFRKIKAYRRYYWELDIWSAQVKRGWFWYWIHPQTLKESWWGGLDYIFRGGDEANHVLRKHFDKYNNEYK